MHFIVCIKQVPDTSEIKIDPETNSLIREGVTAMVNPFDMYAIEEALRLREAMGGLVTVMTMGPLQAETALREAMAMGADQGILLSDPAFAGSDTWATSYTLSMALRRIGDYSLILCGKQAADGDTAQVGPGIAAHMDLPQITFVRQIERISPTGIVAARMLDDGSEILESSLPCVLTVVKEINTPRLPTLKNILEAKKKEVLHWTARDLDCDFKRLGRTGSLTRVLKIFSPPMRCQGQTWTGETKEMIQALMEKVSEAIFSAKSK
ncbi:electron transfer flavoprotein subunit beta/FixA family protein [Desulfuromonas sp. CSMB_57]|uniref:electron transfer flavoprotein subunit beta/FixA family protein n=1 Tax=Desulfuromonas sp. CSMB_57 TaxID=2807629 RepID=UPI001CD4DAF3|nr:electron transfer flavoprotein subunit beta/FixA family protein [Desulfuromonas sp. CSMB_57]